MSKVIYAVWARLNHFSFVFGTLALILVVALLGIQGNPFVALLIIPTVLVGVVLLWWTAHARQSPNLPDTTEDFLGTLKQTGKYALLAFESEFCLTSCLASTLFGKRLLELERTRPDRFQVYSLSVLKNPGKTLFEQFEGRITPTYVLLDTQGNVVMDWPLVLPIERVIYAVEKQTPVRP